MAKKGLSRQTITKLVLKLVSYQAKKQLGEDVIEDIADVLGEEFQEELATKLGWHQDEIIEAFEDADKQFIRQCKNETIKQAIISQPLARIPSLEKFAASLPSSLDDDGLLEMLEQQFANDWKNFTKSQIQAAAYLYRKCLDRSLASKAKQLPETSIRILLRLSTDIEEIKEVVNKLYANQNKSEKQKTANYRRYLRDIILKQRLWQKKYTPMFANFEQLTLYAQVVESDNTTKPLLTLINQTPKLIILGVAGSGKTTTLSKIALENAKRAFNKTRGAFIPILLQLRNYRGSLSELFEAQLRPWGIDLETFEIDLSRGKFLLIFDGINEIPPSEGERCLAELRDLISIFGKNHFLFTSRNIGFQSSQLAKDDKSLIPTCEIQPLTKEQIIDYTSRNLGGKKANLLNVQLGINDPRIWANSRSLAQLVRIPLWLQMVIIVFDKLNRVPRNEGELLLKFVDDVLIQREPTKAASDFSADVKKEILSTIAFKMYEAGLTGEAPKRYIYKIFLDRANELLKPIDTTRADALWHELQKNHLLVEDDEMVSWPHPLFQELFVGLNLRNLCFDDLWRPRYVELEIRFDSLRVKSSLDRDFEAGTTMLGIVPEKYRPDALVAISFYNPAISHEAYLKMEPEYDLNLKNDFLQRCLFHVRASHRGKEHRNLVKTISKVSDVAICPTLAQVAVDCSSWEGREQALYEIWSNCKKKGIDLLQFLQFRAELDSELQVRITALSFLMRLKRNWDIVIPFTLTRLLLEPKDFDQLVRRLVTPDAVQFVMFKTTLISSSLSEQLNLQSRKRAIWIMGEYLPANPSVRTVLMKIINSVSLDLELKREAIHALRGFKSTHIINYLGRSLLNKQDGSLRREAVFTLAAFCDKKALTYILSALKDEDISVADASINSLVQLAERLPVLEKLKDYCRKNDVVLRQRAIKTLSEICLHSDSNVGNASAKILLDYRTISDHIALKDIAIALKGYYPSDSAEIARRLFSVSTMNERQELIELFDAISD
jgi:hypothetical protein